MGAGCTKNGVYIKDKDIVNSEASRVFVQSSKDESGGPDSQDICDSANKSKAIGTIFTEGISSEIIDADSNFSDLQKRMQKIKKMKSKVKTKSERKANSMFLSEKNNEISVPDIEKRRHTDKVGFTV